MEKNMRRIDPIRGRLEVQRVEIVALLLEHGIETKGGSGASNLVTKFLRYEIERLVNQIVRDDDVQPGTEGRDPEN